VGIAINKTGLNVEYLSFYSIVFRAQYPGKPKEIVMNAVDIMTSKVIAVTPETLVREVAALLCEHRISAVPVVDNGRLVGLVSEADLLHRHEIGTDLDTRTGSWWLRLFSADRSPGNYVKSHARQARDVMTREIVSVAADTPVTEIANLLESRGIKRVPVVRDGRLIGIVSRANLIQALAVERRSRKPARPSDDNTIRERLLAELECQPWWRNSSNLIVTDGIVHYWGAIDSEVERQAARVAAENVPGVREVVDHRFSVQSIPYAI
jgi:CBS domain-containing protein